MLGTIVVSYQQTVWEYLNAPRWNSGGCGAGIQDSFPSQDRRLDQISQKPRQVTCQVDAAHFARRCGLVPTCGSRHKRVPG
jgi:hypothetical protein